MANFKKCILDVDNQKLILSADITEEENYHFKFTEVYLDFTETFNCRSNESVNSFTVTLDTDYDESLDSYEIDLSTYPFELENELVFVWLKECKYDSNMREVSTATDGVEYPHRWFRVTLSVKALYEKLLENIDIVNDNCCNVECSDVNTMLSWQGFNLSMSLQDYKQMIYYWKLLHKTSTKSSSGCGCSSK